VLTKKSTLFIISENWSVDEEDMLFVARCIEAVMRKRDHTYLNWLFKKNRKATWLSCWEIKLGFWLIQKLSKVITGLNYW